jgi:hypothetical protein
VIGFLTVAWEVENANIYGIESKFLFSLPPSTFQSALYSLKPICGSMERLVFLEIFKIHSKTICINLAIAPLIPLPGRTYSTILFSDFVEKKNIKDSKKNIAFLLVWDKDSYTQ